MRQGRLFLTGVLAVSLTFPAAVDARPRVFGVLGALFGGIAGGHHHFHHHRHGIAHRHETAPPQAAETETKPTEETPHAQPPRRHRIVQRHGHVPPQPAVAEQQPVEHEQPEHLQAPPPPASLSSLPVADFASIDDDFFGYVFVPSNYDTKLWAHGERDMIHAVFIKGSTSAPPNCSQPGADRATPLIERVEQTTRPNEEQHAALEELKAALAKAFDEVRATCRDIAPITPTARLKAMQERLFAIRDAGLSIRTSLSKFYDSLTDEQRAQFDASDATASTDEKQKSGTRPAAQVCAAQVQAAYAWPANLIGRRVRPNQQQRASLDTLQKTLFGMAMYLKGACPNEAQSTSIARLDAAMHLLDGMLYAVIAISPALDDFYGQLSNEQKARFNSIDRTST